MDEITGLQARLRMSQISYPCFRFGNTRILLQPAWQI